ncbi:MAG: glycosyltransferase [Candidatus Schekmanbacteria bacterium]|nr:MAG: glycosyltransferase [Candidatus Schekmanbacteria bacterium]
MKEKLKIYITGINGIPARHGGFETCVDNVAIRHAEKGLDVVVYCRRRNIKLKDKYYKGVRLVKLPSLGHKSLETLSHTFLSVIHMFFRRKDIVHIYGVGNAIFILFLKLIGTKVVVSADSFDWERDKWGKFAKWFLFNSAKLATKISDAIIVDSKSVQKYYREKFNVETVYIPYGADIGRKADKKVLEKYGLKENDYILFVGRLIPEKGVHNLIEAFVKLKTSKKLAIIGGDWFTTDYIKLLKEKAKNSNVSFLGFVYGDECRAIYSGAYLYVQPSLVDGTSPALLTAMGTGNCVLVNSIPENLETIGNAGLSYEKNDVDSLRNKLSELLENEELVKEYRRKSLERIRKVYSWDRVADSIIEVYKDTLSGKKIRTDVYEKG